MSKGKQTTQWTHRGALDIAEELGLAAPAPAPPKSSSAAHDDPPTGADEEDAGVGDEEEGVAQSGSP